MYENIVVTLQWVLLAWCLDKFDLLRQRRIAIEKSLIHAQPAAQERKMLLLLKSISSKTWGWDC